MNVDRFTVTEWLEANHRDRQWLADQLGVGLSAVGNWLNLKGKPRNIPAEHKITIQRLMEEDEAREAEKPPHTIVLEFKDESFEKIEKKALADGKTVREWAISELNTAAEADMEKVANFYLESTGQPPLKVTEKTSAGPARQEYRFIGQCAAGKPVESERDDTIFVASNLDPDRHVVIEVNGQSAHPAYRDGEKLLIETFPGETRKARKGVPAVFRDSEGCYLKIYEGDNKPLISINPDFDDRVPADGMVLVGYPVEKVPEE